MRSFGGLGPGGRKRMEIRGDYVAMLQALDVDARFELVPDVAHNQIVLSRPFYDAIWEVIE